MKALTAALQLAQAAAQNSEQAASGAQAELQSKTQLVEAAKNRVEQLMKQLAVAKTDLQNTKGSAMKAVAAAHEAKTNAARNRRMMESGNSEKVAERENSRNAEERSLA